MKKVGCKLLKIIFWIFIIITFVYVFFFELPYFLELIFCIETDCIVNKIQNLALIGDSYGVYNTFFSALAFGGLIITLIHQIKSNKKTATIDRFYKMIDYQKSLINEMSVYPVTIDKSKNEVKEVKGRKVFVEYKIQLKYLMKTINKINKEKEIGLTEPDVADVAYSVFYYGSSFTWKPMMLEYLKSYENKELLVESIINEINNSKNKKYILSRPNQNYMSVYFRNMYNAIKLIDSTNIFTNEEKFDYIKVLRAQLCNAELYVLFFNLISRFGKKWIENNYVERYQLIHNLPSKYCDGYDPKNYFPNVRYEDSEATLSLFHVVIDKRKKSSFCSYIRNKMF